MWTGEGPSAILVVPLARPHLAPIRAAGLHTLAGLLAVALQGRQAPSPLPEDDEALRRVVAGVAHELNNPLAIILGYAQVLLEGEAPPELRADLEGIDRAARRVAQLVRDLLAFARQQPIAPTRIDVASLVADALAAEQAALDESSIAVTVAVPQGLPAVRGDRLQLTQVLVHLLAHARRVIVAHPDAGRVTIGAESMRCRATVRLSVADDGPGIAPALLDKVFEPFLLTQDSGLALSVCRSVVRAHGGRIWAANNPEGGATFYVELPTAGSEART